MPHSTTSRKAFSLVELIVAIAIIAVLIGILIPTIAGVRKAAKAADTRNQISRISAAIERYNGDFHAYPGPFSNAQVQPGTVPLAIGSTIGTTPSVPLTGAGPVTSTENMVVALVGGVGVTETTPGTIATFVYEPARLGKGPMNLNPLNPKQYPSYLEPGEDELKNVSGQQYVTAGGATVTFGGSAIPELIDRFQNEDAPRPILYIRAKVGAPGVVDTAGSINFNQYNPRHLAVYGVTSYPEGADPSDTTGISGSYNFFRSASSPAAPNDVPNQKDGFILLSAGKDGVYGTSDDILSYSR
jgi:prepilin-type N-terminal cleavage/methylation domain-containing protein